MQRTFWVVNLHWVDSPDVLMWMDLTFFSNHHRDMTPYKMARIVLLPFSWLECSVGRAVQSKYLNMFRTVCLVVVLIASCYSQPRFGQLFGKALKNGMQIGRSAPIHFFPIRTPFSSQSRVSHWIEILLKLKKETSNQTFNGRIPWK